MFQKTSRSEKVFGKEGWRGIIETFRRKFLSHSTEKFVGEPFSLSLASGTKIIYASEGYVTIIRRRVFVSQYRNISQRNPPLQSFRKFLVAKKFVEKKEEGGVLEISVENVLSGSAEKFRRGIF